MNSSTTYANKNANIPRGPSWSCNLKLKIQSNLVIRNFLVTLKLFLNAKSSLSLRSILAFGHGKWFLNTNLFLIKTFLITKFDCIIHLGPSLEYLQPAPSMTSLVCSDPSKMVCSDPPRMVCNGASQCGYVVSTSAFRQGDPGSNPRAARKSCEVYPGLGILQPQWNPYPTLTPPSC